MPNERETVAVSTKEEATEELTFSGALALIKDGKKLQRTGWNGRGMFVFLGVVEKFWIPGVIDEEESNRNDELEKFEQTPCLIMHTADGNLAFGWRPTTDDMFKSDWKVVEGGGHV